jgi:hypothetical protein
MIAKVWRWRRRVAMMVGNKPLATMAGMTTIQKKKAATVNPSCAELASMMARATMARATGMGQNLGACGAVGRIPAVSVFMMGVPF